MKKIAIVVISLLIVTALVTIIIFKKSSKLTLDEVKKSVVLVEVYDDNGELVSTGSGFCAYDSNYIVTNYHVIDGAYSIKIKTDDKKEHDIEDILIFNKEEDLAILKSNIELNPLKIGDSKKLKTGEQVTTIGSPLGELNTVSTGIISNADNDKGIQISAPISRGSSGGALFDKNYNIIGITYAGYDEAQNLNYAISIDYLQKLYDAYKNNDYNLITYLNFNECNNFTTFFFLNSEPSGVQSAFNGCNDITNKNYSVDSIETFYKISNIGDIYEQFIMESLWSDVYNELSEDDQELVQDYYKSLLSKEICESDCNVINNISSWSVAELFLNLQILSRDELALVMVDIRNYSGTDAQFNRVNEYYPLDAAEKSLILYLLGDFNWYDISRNNKNDIFDFFDNQGWSSSELSAILKYLGYAVETNPDGTITAYWN